MTVPASLTDVIAEALGEHAGLSAVSAAAVRRQAEVVAAAVIAFGREYLDRDDVVERADAAWEDASADTDLAREWVRAALRSVTEGSQE